LEWLREISGLNEARIKLMEERDEAVARRREMEKEFRRIKNLGLDERDLAKYRSLSHLFSRIVNFQAHCEKDKRKLDKMVSEVQKVLRTDIERLSE
jgi:hypothetical protein